jgi:hypothetical protein
MFYGWLMFRTPDGRSTLETHTLMQSIFVAVGHHSDLDNMQYASALQQGAFA